MKKWSVVTFTAQQARILGGLWQTKPEVCDRLGLAFWARKPLSVDLMAIPSDDLDVLIETLENAHDQFKHKTAGWWVKTTRELEETLTPMRRFRSMSAVDKLAEFA